MIGRPERSQRIEPGCAVSTVAPEAAQVDLTFSTGLPERHAWAPWESRPIDPARVERRCNVCGIWQVVRFIPKTILPTWYESHDLLGVTINFGDASRCVRFCEEA